jgi:hypothetical protein
VNTQVGDQIEASYNKWDFHIFKIHKMKLGTVVVILFFIGLIFAAAVWGYRQKIKRHKKKTLLAITWQGER